LGVEPEGRSLLRVIVCDTGPLLHLHEADALQVLASLGEVVIPPAVQQELGSMISGWKVEAEEWIRVVPLQENRVLEAANWLEAGLLDLGEAEALALTRQLDADWLLTDDAAARLVAEDQGREVHGSLGVVLGAAASGYLDAETATEALEKLVRSSLWLSHRVVAEARAALRKIFPSHPNG